MSPRSIQDSEIVDTQILLKQIFAVAANIIGSYHLLLQQEARCYTYLAFWFYLLKLHAHAQKPWKPNCITNKNCDGWNQVV